MSKKLTNLYVLPVLTKLDNFKRLVQITFFFIFVLFLFGSFDDKYPIPEYITVFNDEHRIIKYSREVYHDIYGTVEETTEQVYMKYDNMEESEINFFWSEKNYHNTRDAHKNLHRYKSNVILWEFHPNYKSLDKYCYAE